jgi:transposase
MSDQPGSLPPIPRETVRAATAVFGSSNLYILIGERLERIVKDLSLHSSETGLRQDIPSLPLITFFQFVERLTDTQAEDALRGRVDWKFALHMAISAPAISGDLLCSYRQRLLQDAGAQQGFQTLVERLSSLHMNPCITNEGLDVSEILSAVCSFTRMQKVLEAMRNVLEYLAARHGDCLRKTAMPHWYTRYQSRASLPHSISGKNLLDLMRAIGMDAAHLLDSISTWENSDVAASAEVQELRRVWNHHFSQEESAGMQTRPLCSFCEAADRCTGTGKEAHLKLPI